MKKQLLSFALLLFCAATFAQTTPWTWAKSAGGTSSDVGRMSATDNSGNIIVAGGYKSATITFGNTTLTNIDTTTNRVFIVKYDASGNVLWAKSIVGTSTFIDIKTDNNGNIYIVGYFLSKIITIGSVQLINRDTSSFTTDIFIAKYDPSGNLLWAKNVGGKSLEFAEGINIDMAGYIYIIGQSISDSIYFNNKFLYNVYPNYTFFVAKMNPLGNFIWTKGVTVTGSVYGKSICSDSLCNLYILGSFTTSTIHLGTINLTKDASNTFDIFLAKYDSSGNPIWAKAINGPNKSDYGSSIINGKNGNILITGYFSSPTLAFGTTTLNNKSTTGTSDIYIASYNLNGNFNWAKSIGGDSADMSYGVSSDPSGNFYLTGYFLSPSIAFDTTIISNFSAGTYDAYVAKYNSNGNVIWVSGIGGSSNDYGYGVSTDAQGNAYVTGLFQSSTLKIGNTTLNQVGGGDMFLAKLSGAHVGISSINNIDAKTISIYPNPSTKNFTIEFPSSTKQIQIINTLGEVLQTKTVEAQTNQNFELTKTGIYFIRIITDESIITKRLLINE